jgi:hypothetical protein
LSSRLLDLTRELRQRHDRHVQLLGQRLQAGGDLGDFLHAAFRSRAPRRALQQLDIVDHQQVEAALALEPARAGCELRDGDAAGLVDRAGMLLHFARAPRALEIRSDIAAADRARRGFPSARR